MNETFQDFFLSCKECVLENPRNFYGCFSLGPFKNSQSLTVANALRRTLLTEISAIAITHVEINGVLHEYSTLEGVRESVLDMLLNFKQIVLKSSSPLTKPVYGYLNVRGPGIVRVSDLKLPPNIQYIDPDQYIATLNENGKLCLKVTISDLQNSQKNKNFQNVFLKNLELKNSESFIFDHLPGGGQQKGEAIQKFVEKTKKTEEISKNKKTNSLWVDPTFNPILKVNYLIENLEPIQETLQNQAIRIELWTNGSIHPRKALYMALDSLKKMFNKLDEMRFLNSRLYSQFFESEETLTQILKSFEYDFEFYSVLDFQKNPIFLSQKNFLGEDQKNLNNLESGLLHEWNEKNKNQRSLQNSHFSTFQKYNMDLPIQELNLPHRISQSLIQHKFFKIQDLLKFSPKELQKFCGIGNFSLCLIQKKLKKMGFQLKNEKEI